MIKLSQLIIEGRVDDFKEKYKSIPDDVKHRLITNDPSNNYKYLDWMGKIVTSERNVDINDVLKNIITFDKYQSSLGDVNKFKSLSDLKHALSSRTKSNKEKKREGAEILIDDDDFLVVAPFTQEGCGYYGNNTSWCIVNQESYWNQYYYKNSIIIVLDRRDGEKYAVVGNDTSDPDVYEKNDASLHYSSFVGDDDGQWPEYVHTAIQDYMSSDDVERRKSKFEEEIVTEYISENGTDEVWENYLYRIHREYKILKNRDLKRFKYIASSEHNVSEEELANQSKNYMYNKVIIEGDFDKDNIADVNSSTDLEQALKDMGELVVNGECVIEHIAHDYINAQLGIDEYLDMIKNKVGFKNYENLMSKNIDDELVSAMIKYNNMINSPKQSSLNGIPVGKESVKINNVSDIIHVLNRTGHENIGGYLSSVSGLRESKKIKTTKILL